VIPERIIFVSRGITVYIFTGEKYVFLSKFISKRKLQNYCKRGGTFSSVANREASDVKVAGMPERSIARKSR